MDDSQIAEIAIQNQSDLSSEELAVRQANQVEGLQVNDEGEVESFNGDKKEILSQLVEKYEEMMGNVATNLIAEEMKNRDVEASELPEKLSEKI
ncbi:hypothetical protein AQV86_03305 [Nanohaloarchaea archaeon SG9]|nr:hypothetical protein AQV86_03305 [Nanohaloarchaea archaeon SG9]